jgi:hypothetical protein
MYQFGVREFSHFHFAFILGASRATAIDANRNLVHAKR